MRSLSLEFTSAQDEYLVLGSVCGNCLSGMFITSEECLLRQLKSGYIGAPALLRRPQRDLDLRFNNLFGPVRVVGLYYSTYAPSFLTLPRWS